MLLHILVYSSEVILIKHAEFDLLCRRGNDQIEGVAQDGGVRYAGYGSKIEEGERFFEAVEDTNGCKEQVA